MRGIIVGFGRIGMTHFSAYQSLDGIEICAIVDPVASRRELAAAIMPDISTYASLAEALASESSDFIDICTPPIKRADTLDMALSVGGRVLCEKPVATTWEELEDIRSIALTHSGLLAACHNYAFLPAFEDMIEVVGTNEDQMEVEYKVLREKPASGVSEWNPFWRVDPSIAGGGIIMDHGIHAVTIARRFFGEFPTKVRCTAKNMHTLVGGLDVAAQLDFQFPRGNFHCSLSWLGERRSTHLRVRTNCELLTLNDDLFTRSAGGQALEPKTVSGFSKDMHLTSIRNCIWEFLNAGNNESNRVLYLDNLTRSMASIFTAYESASYGGVWLDIPEEKCFGSGSAPRITSLDGSQ